jgi:hypothetical protein
MVDVEDYGFLCSITLQIGESPTVSGKILPPSSGPTSQPICKSTEAGCKQTCSFSLCLRLDPEDEDDKILRITSRSTRH